MYAQSPSTLEINIVLNWLRDIAPQRSEIQIQKKPWLYTREEVKLRARSNFDLNPSRKQLVSQLDPDAPLRQQKPIAEEDKNYERILFRAVFEALRQGNFDDATDLFRESGYYWRAASFQGLLEFRDVWLDTGRRPSEGPQTMGTRNKALWRRMCYRLACCPEVDIYERAIYGVCAGELSSILAVSKTWEDLVWAHSQVISIAQLERYVIAIRNQTFKHDFAISNTDSIDLSQVLENLLQGDSDKEKYEQPFRLIQSRIIQNKVDDLISEMNNHFHLLRSESQTKIMNDSLVHVLRVLVHLCLALTQAGVSIVAETQKGLLLMYIELLNSISMPQLIPLYIAQLPIEDRSNVYGDFLSTVKSMDSKYEQLNLAKNYDIDIPSAIKKAMDMTTKGFLLSNYPENVILTSLDAPITAAEETQIRNLEWPEYQDRIKRELVSHGNILFRRLFLMGRVNTTKILTERMPSSKLASPDHLEEISDENDLSEAIEYLNHTTICEIFDRCATWETLFSAKPVSVCGVVDSMAISEWEANLAQVLESVAVAINSIIDGDRLHPDSLNIPRANYPERYDQLLRIRDVYLSELVIRLHTVYHKSHIINERYLEACMELVSVVASEDKSVYNALRKTNRLKEYMGLVKDASLSMLKSTAGTKGDDILHLWQV